MKSVYLANGQVAYLQEVLGPNKFLVKKVFVTTDTNDEEIEIEDDSVSIVDKVFDKPPVAKISQEILKLQETKGAIQGEITKLSNEKRRLELDVQQLQQTEISNKRVVINKTELLKAKSIAVFPDKHIMPIVLTNKDGRDFYGLKLNFEFKLTEQERCWVYKLYKDSYMNHDSYYVSFPNSILVNPTEEELDVAILARLATNQWEEPYLRFVPDKYLSEELLKRKHNIFTSEAEKEKKQAEESVVRAQEQLEKAKNKLEKLLNPA